MCACRVWTAIRAYTVYVFYIGSMKRNSLFRSPSTPPLPHHPLTPQCSSRWLFVFFRLDWSGDSIFGRRGTRLKSVCRGEGGLGMVGGGVNFKW